MKPGDFNLELLTEDERATRYKKGVSTRRRFRHYYLCRNRLK